MTEINLVDVKEQTIFFCGEFNKINPNVTVSEALEADEKLIDIQNKNERFEIKKDFLKQKMAEAESYEEYEKYDQLYEDSLKDKLSSSELFKLTLETLAPFFTDLTVEDMERECRFSKDQDIMFAIPTAIKLMLKGESNKKINSFLNKAIEMSIKKSEDALEELP